MRSCNKLSDEYHVLLFGGTIEWISTTTRSEFMKYSPAVVFNDKQMAFLFFDTRACLRNDPSTCFLPDSQYYAVSGCKLIACEAADLVGTWHGGKCAPLPHFISAAMLFPFHCASLLRQSAVMKMLRRLCAQYRVCGQCISYLASSGEATCHGLQHDWH